MTRQETKKGFISLNKKEKETLNNASSVVSKILEFIDQSNYQKMYGDRENYVGETEELKRSYKILQRFIETDTIIFL